MDTDMDELDNPGCGGRGGDGCDCGDCEEWRRFCYWNHDHGHTRQFLLYASDNKDFLCIPWEVTKQLRNMITDSEPIKLEASDGQVYSVEFIKFGLIILTTGWRHFVDANNIRQGDPILFVYCGGSSFKVHICSSSGPENSLPCSQQPPDIFRAVPPRDHHVLNEQVVPDPAHVRMSTDFGYTMFPGTWLTKAQEKKVLELADSSMRSEIPLHVASVNKRNASKDNYVLLHLQDSDRLVFRSMRKDRLEVLVLDPSGCEKTCFAMGNSSNAREVDEDSVEIVDPPPHTVIDLSSDDDEVVEKGTTTSRREERPLQGCRAKAQKMASTSSPRTKSVMGEGTTTPRREQRPLRGCRAKAQQMDSTSSPCTKSGHKAGKSKEAALEAPMSNKPYISREGMDMELTSDQKEKIMEKVRAIGSEFPVFVKVMTKPELDEPIKLVFCVEYNRACLPLEQTPVLLELEGSKMQWPSTLKVKRDTDRKWITKSWKELVLRAGMKPGDICLVELARTNSENLKDDGPSDP